MRYPLTPQEKKKIVLNIEWNFTEICVDIFMPGYVQKIPQVFLHEPPSRPQYVPQKWTEFVYG